MVFDLQGEKNEAFSYTCWKTFKRVYIKKRKMSLGKISCLQIVGDIFSLIPVSCYIKFLSLILTTFYHIYPWYLFLLLPHLFFTDWCSTLSIDLPLCSPLLSLPPSSSLPFTSPSHSLIPFASFLIIYSLSPLSPVLFHTFSSPSTPSTSISHLLPPR